MQKHFFVQEIAKQFLCITNGQQLLNYILMNINNYTLVYVHCIYKIQNQLL